MENTSTDNGPENPEVKDGPVNTRDLEEDFLAGLQESLAGRGVVLRIVTPEDGSLYLEVKAKPPDSKKAAVWVALADGVWWFWWGTQQARRFGRADDPDGAAETVLRTLGSGR